MDASAAPVFTCLRDAEEELDETVDPRRVWIRPSVVFAGIRGPHTVRVVAGRRGSTRVVTYRSLIPLYICVYANTIAFTRVTEREREAFYRQVTTAKADERFGATWRPLREPARRAGSKNRKR